MSFRKTLLLVAISACYVTSSRPATLRTVDVSRDQDRYRVVADTHLDASPEAIYKVLLDFDGDRYQRISEIYKESSYLPPDSDGTPLVYTRVEGCLMLFCRSMSRVERLEVVTPQFIRSRTVPERSDFKYSLAEWTFAAEGERHARHLPDGDGAEFLAAAVRRPVVLEAHAAEGRTGCDRPDRAARTARATRRDRRRRALTL